jgi:DNA-binding winged helix-turn-helix (wHTH) protein
MEDGMPNVIFAFDEFELDATWHELRCAGNLVQTPAGVLRLIKALVDAAPNAISRNQLSALVWKGEIIGENALNVAIGRARKVLGHQRGVREIIVSVRGKGYRFLPPVVRRGGPIPEPSPLRSMLPRKPPPLVGRARELEQLHTAMRAALCGRGRMCIVSGEAAVGKSFLLERFAQALPAGVRVAWGIARSAADVPPLWPWRTILRQLLPEGSAAPHGEPQSEDALATRCSETLRSILLAATRTPLLLIVEDLHHADEATLAVVRDAADAIADARVLVVVTLRSEDARASTAATVEHLRAAGQNRELVLERLSEHHVSAYLEEVANEVDPGTVQWLYAESLGNPYLMAELTHQWLAAGRSRSPCVVEGTRHSTRHVLASRDEKTLSTLAVAAVIGKRFEHALLASLAGIAPQQLAIQLAIAAAMGMCVAEPDPPATSRFVSEIQRGLLYEEVPPSQRRSLHERIGIYLAECCALGEPVSPSDIAHHFYAALPNMDPMQTVRWCREAARAAAEAYDWRACVRHTKHALDALSLLPQPSARLRMQLLAALCLFARAVDGTHYRSASRILTGLALRRDDSEMIVRGALLLNLHPGFQPLGAAADALQRVLTKTPPIEPNWRASALSALATSAPVCFTERALALVDEAASLAQASDDPSAQYAALLAQLYLYGGPANVTRSGELELEVALLASRNRRTMPMLSVDLALHRSVVSLQKADFQALHGSIELAATRARRIANEELHWYAARFRALSKLNIGRFAQAAAQLAVLHREADEHDIFGTGALCAFDRTVSLRALRGIPPCDAKLHSALAFSTSDPPSVWSMKLRALAELGLLESARTALHAIPTPAMLRRLPCDVHYLGTLGHLARAATRLREHDYAEVIYDLLAPYEAYYAAQQSFYCEGSVPQVRGILAWALGRHDEAAVLLARGIAMNDQVGLKPMAAEARLELAQCLWDRGHREDRARTHQLVHEAKARSDALGLYGLSAEIAQFARTLEAPVPLKATRLRSRDERSDENTRRSGAMSWRSIPTGIATIR